MFTSLVTVLLALMQRCGSSYGFTVTPIVSRRSTRVGVIIEPGLLMDGAIALVSAAAGAASQLPRVQELERQLNSARSALSESEQELVAKVSELEEKLFRMDEEYEAQSTKVKKTYDSTMKDELRKVAEKIKEDYKFRLDIRLAEQKQDLLSEKLKFVNDLNGEKEIELVNLRLRQGQISEANKKLQDALAKSQSELDNLNANIKKKRRLWPF